VTISFRWSDKYYHTATIILQIDLPKITKQATVSSALTEL